MVCGVGVAVCEFDVVGIVVVCVVVTVRSCFDCVAHVACRCCAFIVRVLCVYVVGECRSGCRFVCRVVRCVVGHGACCGVGRRVVRCIRRVIRRFGMFGFLLQLIHFHYFLAKLVNKLKINL